MPDAPTTQEIEEALRVCEAATPGPWKSRLGSGNNLCTGIASDSDEAFDEWVCDCLPEWMLDPSFRKPKNHVDNMKFIELARTLLPRALRALLAAREDTELLDGAADIRIVDGIGGIDIDDATFDALEDPNELTSEDPSEEDWRLEWRKQFRKALRAAIDAARAKEATRAD